MWVDKVWGRTKELVDSPFYSCHELEIVAGGYCSMHFHRHRANRFTVTSGLVEIVEFFGPFVIRTHLGPGNTYDVASLVPHMFIVHKSGAMFEEYFSDRGGQVRRDDIVRLVEGGKLDVSRLGELPECLLNRLTSLPTLKVK
jgi:hypothetical protein